jgi:hypothetical protein
LDYFLCSVVFRLLNSFGEIDGIIKILHHEQAAEESRSEQELTAFMRQQHFDASKEESHRTPIVQRLYFRIFTFRTTTKKPANIRLTGLLFRSPPLNIPTA